ncbi:MAG: class I SAM-dependent methyltransferase [Anaerolineales bacterium]|nr:class I SAM-dependent methyltransferase [Anaerolineales bacterium]
MRATQEFFTARAAHWETRFPDDAPRYAQAVQALVLAPGAHAVDVGCGTGRAVAPLRAALGAAGQILAIDATPAMLAEAQRLGWGALTALAVADALRLPVPAAWADVVFAGGLLPHLDNPAAALTEWARVVRPGGALAIFHPLSRAALAVRHNHMPSDDDVLAAGRLRALCAAAGWQVTSIDDSAERYLALAVRRSAAAAL